MPALANNISADLVLTLALFAVFAGAVRRGMLAGREAGWVGTALVFFGGSLVFNAVLGRNALTYPHKTAKIVGLSLLMTLPLLLALGYGVVALARTLAAKTLSVVQIGVATLLLVSGNPASFAANPPLDGLLWPTFADLPLRGREDGPLRAFGGPAVVQEARALAPLSVGKAVCIGAGSLGIKHLVLAAIHSSGKPAADPEIKRALDAAFYCARQNNLRRVALPPFGTLTGRRTAAQIASLTVSAAVRACKDCDFIAVVVFDKRLLPAFQAEFDALAQKHPAGSV